jgi:hypothetical protein
MDSPQDWALAFAFPLKREEFLQAVETEPADGFVRHWASSLSGYPVEKLWDDYEPIADYANQLAEEACAAGVLVRRSATLTIWLELLRARKIISLVAHWAEREHTDWIQFTDGFASLSKCIGGMPAAFCGLLDLTVCHSSRFIDQIKRMRPKSRILANRNVARLGVRLAMYRQLLALLQTGDYTFIDAMRKIHLSALEEL